LLKDVDPVKRKRLAEDPDLRKKQVEGVQQLLAFACEAEKRGLARDENNIAELENIRSETIAVNYDRQVSKPGTGLPFSRVTAEQVSEFYKDPANSASFERFLKVKVAMLHRNNPQTADVPLTDEEVQQAKDFFAKIRISENESIKNAASLGPAFKYATDLQAILQQDQFLARLVSDQLAAETSPSDAEIQAYIAAHPEFDASAKKAAAAKLLARAKAGEDFAALANQNTQDPGNNGPNGTKNGGLYKNVPKGTMVQPFENAALSLKPGEIYPELVESDFGYHIIKLESRSGTGDDTKYDVRHILISTTVKDPENPAAREMPVKDFVRGRLESEKESGVVAKIVASNPVVMEEFVIPPAADAKAAAKKPAAKRPAARKPAARRRHK
jgi:parvulin-like peptidyl-prolyl isomerase